MGRSEGGWGEKKKESGPALTYFIHQLILEVEARHYALSMSYWLNIFLVLISYTITAIALTLLVVNVRRLVKIYQAGQPDPTRRDNRGARMKNMFREVLGHTKMLNFTGTGIAHWFVMIGFISLFGTLITAYGQITNPNFVLPIIGHFYLYEYFTEVTAWATGIGIVTLIGIRQFTRIFRKDRDSRFHGSGMWKAYYIEATILAIVFCVIALRGLEGALSPDISWNRHFITTWFIAQEFKNLSLESILHWIQIVAAIKIIVSMSWFIVISLNLTMGVAWHRFLAFFNIYYKRHSDGTNSLGELPEMLSHGKAINFDDPAEDDLFGLGVRGDISWKGLMDMTSCTECGRCQSQCPAWHTDKPLSPKLLIMAMRDHAMSKVAEGETLVGPSSPISFEVLWSCTTCGACVNECPVDIEHIDHIVNMRRFQVLVESEFPSELGGTFRNLESSGNPWGSNKSERNTWITECDFPIREWKANYPMMWNIFSGWVVLALMKSAPRKPPKQWLNFFTWLGFPSPSWVRKKLVREIQLAERAMNFFTKYWPVKI